MSKLFKKQKPDEAAEFSMRFLGEKPRGGVGVLEFRQVGLCGPLVGGRPKEAERENGAAKSRTTENGASSTREQEDNSRKDYPPAPPAPKVDVDAIQRQAFQQGYSEGKRAGSEKAMEQFQAPIAAFGRTVQQLAAFKNELRRQAEQELVELSLAIAQRVVRRQLSVDPTTILALVRICFEEYRRAEIHSVRVHPEDLDAVAAYFEENPVSNLDVQADPNVERGGAVFETAQGELDARIATQLKEIEYGLADR